MIETNRLKIERFAPSHALMLSLLSIEEPNRRFLTNEVFENESSALEAILKFEANYDGTSGPFVYALLRKDDGLLIGNMEAAILEDGRWEVGYHIGEKYTGHGYAKEALCAFVPFIAKKLSLKELCGICLETNIPSRNVLEKCGFKLEYKGKGDYLDRIQDIRRYVIET
ncbi:MAG: GNAT family N-acetyltransferase [Clostridiaceae bacterium]|nr:GNAT family N-acetyltransferase [Clostridiaceae bacterium]